MPGGVAERDVDCGQLYDDERRSFVALLRTLAPENLELSVSATPDWSVHDVLAHVVGITADLNALRFGHGGTPEDWTARQVAERRDRTLDDLDEEWAAEAPLFEEGLRELGYEIGSHYVGDLLQHTGDVRHALGMPPDRDNPALPAALDFYLSSLEQSLDAAAVGAVRIETGDEQWSLGPRAVAATLRTDRYEVFRMLGGRRTCEEMRAAHWSGDVDAIIDLLSRYPVPAVPLGELA